eukprot:476342-Ditylum_brightwellii.AAC.1
MELITRLTHDNEPFVWGEEQQAAFKEIKRLVLQTMMLVYPQLDKTFGLYPDTCDVQIGGFLVQEEMLLGCFSRKMNSAQRNYPMMDKELLAAHQCLKHFDNIIQGGKIWIFCNHKNLTFGRTTANQSQRVLRQKIDISNNYNAEFLHIAGAEN